MQSTPTAGSDGLGSGLPLAVASTLDPPCARRDVQPLAPKGSQPDTPSALAEGESFESNKAQDVARPFKPPVPSSEEENRKSQRSRSPRSTIALLAGIPTAARRRCVPTS